MKILVKGRGEVFESDNINEILNYIKNLVTGQEFPYNKGHYFFELRDNDRVVKFSASWGEFAGKLLVTMDGEEFAKLI